MPWVKAWDAEFDQAVAIEQQVGEGVAGQMAAFEQHPALRAGRQQFAQTFGSTVHLAHRFGRALFEQHAGFRQIGGDDESEWEQRFAQHADRRGGEQTVAAFGNHHRVEDDVRRLPVGEAVGDGGADFGAAEHADLAGIDAHIDKQGVELLTQEIGRRHVYAGHALGVLRGEGGDHAATIGAECGKGFQVSQHAGAARRIDSGNGDDVWNESRRSGVNSEMILHMRFPTPVPAGSGSKGVLSACLPQAPPTRRSPYWMC